MHSSQKLFLTSNKATDTLFQGEEDEVSSIADEDDCENLHRKFMRRNVPLYLPKIVIPKHETQG